MYLPNPVKHNAVFCCFNTCTCYKCNFIRGLLSLVEANAKTRLAVGLTHNKHKKLLISIGPFLKPVSYGEFGDMYECLNKS